MANASVPEPTNKQKPPAPTASLTDRTASGFAWLMIQVLGSKVTRMVIQIVLAWLLEPDDFGLFAMVIAIGSIASLLMQGGIRQVLIRRHRRYDLWATPAMWMSLSMGFLTAVALAASAPLIAKMYGEPQVTGLLLIMSLVPLTSALITIPVAKLEGSMRYRTLSLVNLVPTMVAGGGSVLLAILGFGAYSLAIPMPLSNIALACVLFVVVRPQIRWQPQFARWRYLWTDISAMAGVTLLGGLTSNLDYVALGIFQDATVVGFYYFAFNLSMQTMSLINVKAMRVLLPALSTMNKEPSRQLAAFMRVLRLILIVGAPLGLLQAALAEPVLALVFGSRWADSIPILQVLSIGMVLRLISGPSSSLFQAQGRFMKLLWIQCVWCALFTVMVFFCSWRFQGFGLAIAVAVFYGIYGVTFAYLASRLNGGRFVHLITTIVRPIAAGAAVIGVMWLGGSFLPDTTVGHVVRIVGTLVLSLGAYSLIIRKLEPQGYKELRDQVGRLVRRRNSTPDLDSSTPKEIG